MTVGPTRQDVLDDGRHRTRVRVTFGDGSRRGLTFVTGPDVPFVQGNLGDIWLPVMLVMAMRHGEDLELADPVSERAAALVRLQDIYSTWYPRRMRRVEVHAPPTEPARRRWRKAPERVTGTFFTGGVDSFYTLGKNRHRLGALVYGLGIDVPLRRTEAIERTTTMLQQVADETGTRLLTARTSMRTFLGKDARWGSEAHGAALASLATLFSPVLDRVLVPATHSYAMGLRWGSHPLLDPLWSTDRLAVEHDGAEASRAAKTERIADDPVAQRHLRVCHVRFDDTNCCRCFKCLRTMTHLAALDRLDDVATFHEPLDLERFASFPLQRINKVYQVRDLYRHVRRRPGHEDIKDALRGMLDRSTVGV